MLIITGWPWADHVLAQQGIERFTLQVGEFVQERLGLGLGGEDAADRRQGEGAEANGAFQGLEHIVAPIVGQQRQQLLRLQLALGLFGEQAVEELHGDRVRVRGSVAARARRAGRDRRRDDGS